jgi:hypothetical protein
MGGVPPTHDAVRIYLDSAVAEAAERWVGRATDATAYADLIAAVLARREALSPMVHLPEIVMAEPPPVRPGLSSRHHERRSRPRWPLGSPPPDVDVAASPQAPHATPAPSPTVSQGTLTTRPAAPQPGDETRESGLPTRPPGRHRTPPPPPETPVEIDLNDRLTTVLDWLGRPEV